MTERDFIYTRMELSLDYKMLFGTVPCMQNYKCSREEYINALKKSIDEKKSIDNYLERAEIPFGTKPNE